MGALGRVEERYAGLQTIPLDSVLGTVDRKQGFDRQFRPDDGPRRAARWERIANAVRRGEAMPPISVYRIGEVHFVRDGHHRVSVARALGRTDIDAYVVEVVTRVGAERSLTSATCPRRATSACSTSACPSPRVPATAMRVTTPGATASWPRPSRRGPSAPCRSAPSSGTAARRRAAGTRTSSSPSSRCCARPTCSASAPRPTPTCGVAAQRYRLLFTHEWSEDVLARLRERDRAVSRGPRARWPRTAG